jgi:3-oxoacyl-[acyl-carrier-protein] synthase-1
VSGQIKVSSENIPTSKQSFIKMISGFGGCNAAVLVTKDAEPVYECKPSPRLETKHHVRITPTQVLVDGNEIAFEGEGKSMLTNIYKRRINNYPKFYKMDSLSRLGFVASELLLEAEGRHPDSSSSDRAVILFNHSSSVQADKAFQASIQDPADYFPSPAAFVYTLPNIVAGEISIRNHYQGETSFYVLPAKDERLMELIINATFGDRHTRSVLGGWLDYKDDARFEADLFIVENQNL